MCRVLPWRRDSKQKARLWSQYHFSLFTSPRLLHLYKVPDSHNLQTCHLKSAKCLQQPQCRHRLLIFFPLSSLKDSLLVVIKIHKLDLSQSGCCDLSLITAAKINHIHTFTCLLTHQKQECYEIYMVKFSVAGS